MKTAMKTTKKTAKKTAPPVIVVHHLGHARAALKGAETLGIAVRLESAANTAAQGGALWFAHVIAAAAGNHPAARFEAVLDCGPAAGRALGAIREFAEQQQQLAIRTQVPPRARAKICAIGKAARVPVHEGRFDRRRALDLLDAPDPDAAVAAYLASRAGKAPEPLRKPRRNRMAAAERDA